MNERVAVTVRQAYDTDTQQVMELSSHIWEGEDYIPYVWSEWLSDPQGLLVVAEHQERIVGLGKLTRLSEEDWWLEGLRVHPEFEGLGIASQLHEYLFNTWKRIGNGSVRLGTASFRLPVHHLCKKFGFRKVGECTPFVAHPLDDPTILERFHLLRSEDAMEAAHFAQNSPSLTLSNGLMDLGWQWAPPRKDYLSRMINDQKIWWWNDRRGLLSLREDKDPDKEPSLVIQIIACPMEEIVELLLDFRRLTHALGYQRAGWMAPLSPDLLPHLEAASFARDWDASMFLFSYP